ncbi:MAG: TonB-dependent receptor [Gammaproteobacteria bacterium]|nr:MAG: TonB-dependent receptor [Gammaproteobacteria bacterium]
MNHLPRKTLLSLFIAAAWSWPAAAQDTPGDGDNVEEIIVRAVRSADLNAREVERMKDVFSSVITQDDAGNFADQNVAEALQRLPGITLQRDEGEGRFINLRGLGPDFVTVQMNGAEIANSSGGANENRVEGRGFSLDALPADVVKSIEVLKTLTPDMDLNAIGGAVDIKTLSPLERGRDSLKLRLQTAYQEQAGEVSPKFTVQGVHLFADQTFGLGYSLSYEKRVSRGYETLHHEDTLPRYVQVDDSELPPPDADDPRMLIPWEFQNRQENAERERQVAMLDLEYRPRDAHRFWLRYSLTRYTDDDEALREYYRFGQAGSGEVAWLHPAGNRFGLGGVDLQHQVFIQEAESQTQVATLGAEHRFAGDWDLNWEFVHSVGELDSPDGRRVQFRLRDLTVLGGFGPDYLNGQVVAPEQLAALAGLNDVAGAGGMGPSGYQLGQTRQPFMLYDNLFIEDSYREDRLDTFKLDLRKDFADGRIHYLKTGLHFKDRSRMRDKDRASLVPGDKAVAGCGGDLECVQMAGSRLGDFATRRPEHPGFDHELITPEEAERLIAATRAIADNFDPNEVEVESTRRDYRIDENVQAAYLMAEFALAPRSTLIAGARYERTEFQSTGFLAIRNDREESADQLESFDIAVPLTDTRHEYDGWFPGLHYRQELDDTKLLRAALWTSFTRPSFDQARAYAEITDRVIFCNNDPDVNFNGEPRCSDRPSDLQGDLPDEQFTDAYKATHLELAPQNVMRVGNPKLQPMTATNFDLSFGWYASEDLFFQAALFYKDIDDFIVEVSGVDIELDKLPFDLPVEQVTRFVIPEDATVENGITYLNGEGARVWGLELSYNQYFTEGWLNDFFVQSNLTLQQSKADVGDAVRVDDVPLPDQADVAFNATFGWENDSLSLRLIGNYTSEVLRRIGACTQADIAADQALGYAANCRRWADVYQDDLLTFDFKATWNIAKGYKLYFDAVNLTDEPVIQAFEGNAYSNGPMLFSYEAYGRSVQLGLYVDLF